MTTAIDLFAGLGGWSAGARAAGVQVLWAANHWPVAVEWHSANHPETQHVCQDLHRAFIAVDHREQARRLKKPDAPAFKISPKLARRFEAASRAELKREPGDEVLQPRL